MQQNIPQREPGNRRALERLGARNKGQKPTQASPTEASQPPRLIPGSAARRRGWPGGEVRARLPGSAVSAKKGDREESPRTKLGSSPGSAEEPGGGAKARQELLQPSLLRVRSTFSVPGFAWLQPGFPVTHRHLGCTSREAEGGAHEGRGRWDPGSRRRLPHPLASPPPRPLPSPGVGGWLKKGDGQRRSRGRAGGRHKARPSPPLPLPAPRQLLFLLLPLRPGGETQPRASPRGHRSPPPPRPAGRACAR